MGKFVITQAATGYKFNLKASNGETVATSEVYSTKAAAIAGAESVIKVAPEAKFADLTVDQEATNPKFELYEDKAGEYRFRLKARNGEIIAASEGYKTKSACENGIESVRKNAPIANLEDQTAENYETATNPKFEMYEDKGGAYRFRLKSRNGQIIAISEGYTTKAACENGIESVRKNAPEAEIEEE